MGWEVGGRSKSEEIYIYLWLIHADIWQKPVQYYKAITCRLKVNIFLKKRNIYLGLPTKFFELGFFFNWVEWAVCKFWRLISCQLLCLQMFSFILKAAFQFVDGFLCCAKAFKFNWVPFVYFCLYFHYCRRWVKKLLLWLCQRVYMISSKSFYSVQPYTRSLIHFKFLFVYGDREYSNFILLHVAVQFYQHHLLKRPSFLHHIFMLPLS